MALDNATKNASVYSPKNDCTTASSKKIIYYKLNSPYREDYTKNCGLVGSEIDSNFFNLKEMSIKSVGWDSSNNEIVLTRVDDEELRVKGLYEQILSDYKEFDFKYNTMTGTLTITTPVETFEIEGFFTDEKTVISTNDTLVGDGCISNPIGISSIAQTGRFKPVNSVVEEIEGESIEITLGKLNPVKGDRYITVEKISNFGRLYDYYGVEKMMKDLKLNASEWRIPSKTDWDVMLTCVEECVCKNDKNPWHDSLLSNEDLGRIAGKRLKTKDLWKENPETETPSDYDSDYVYSTEGIDSKNFSVLPLGYGDEHNNPSKGFGRYSAFWTLTLEDDKHDVYTKRFNFDKNTVYQASTEPTERLSVRLVKTFNGKNYNDSESINGMTYPCVMIEVPSNIKNEVIYSADNNKETNLYATIWTQINIGFSNPDYLPKSNIVDDEWNGKEDYEIRYFINDWDGKKWTKHEFKEGEAVVIKDEYKGVKMHEWILTNKELVDSLSDSLDYLKNELHEEFNTRFELIDGTISEIVETNKVLRDDITTLQSNVETLKSEIESEALERKEADEILQKAIITETLERKNADKNLENEIIAEQKRAEESEKNLDGRIEAEITRAKGAEEELKSEIDSEIIRATGAENELQNNINAEALARQNADESLQNELNKTQKSAGLTEDGSYVPNISFEDRVIHYIDKAESLNDADIKLDQAIQGLDKETVKNISVNGVIGEYKDNIASVTIDTSVINVGPDIEIVEPDIEEEGHLHIHSGDGVSLAFAKIVQTYKTEVSRREDTDKRLTEEIARSNKKDEELEKSIINEIERATKEDDELTQAISDAKDEIIRLQEKMTFAETDIENLEGEILVTKKDIQENKDAISSETTARLSADTELQKSIDTLFANKVEIEDGKGLSTNDFTDVLLNKVNSIEENAQVNKIEKVFVDDVLLDITDNKEVKIVMPKVPVQGVYVDDNILSLNGTELSANISIAYDKITKQIILYGKDTSKVISTIDVSDFVKDGMIDKVEVVTLDNGKTVIRITWNTESGYEITDVPADSLIQVYEAGEGLIKINDTFSIKLNTNVTENFLRVDNNGLYTEGIKQFVAEAIIASEEKTNGQITNLSNAISDTQVSLNNLNNRVSEINDVCNDINTDLAITNNDIVLVKEDIKLLKNKDTEIENLAKNSFTTVDGDGISLELKPGTETDRTNVLTGKIKGYYTYAAKPEAEKDSDYSLLRLTDNGYMFVTNSSAAMKHLDAESNPHVLSTFVNSIKLDNDKLNADLQTEIERAKEAERVLSEELNLTKAELVEANEKIEVLENTLNTLLRGENADFMAILKKAIINSNTFKDDETDPTVEVVVTEGENVLVKTKEDAVYMGSILS